MSKLLQRKELHKFVASATVLRNTLNMFRKYIIQY